MKTTSDLFKNIQLSVPDWVGILGLAAAGMLAGWIAHYILFAVVHRLMRRDHPLVASLMTHVRSLTRFALIVMALGLLQPFAPLDRQTDPVVHSILVCAFIVLIGWSAIAAVNLAMDHYMTQFRLDTTNNLLARKAVTQTRVLKCVIDVVLLVLTAGFALMTFKSVRQFGISLFASAGVAGIVAGLAARPLLGNLVAGIQIAFTQPIRLGDVLVIQNERGTVEEITSSYVVMKLWDWRRLIVPLSFFFENAFQNWTRVSSALIGSVFIYTDYTVPIESVRRKLQDIVRQSKLWDHNVVNLQVTDAKENTMELRVLVSAPDSAKSWDLRCEVREKLIAWLQAEFPGCLQHTRAELALKRLPSPEEKLDGAGTRA